MNDSLDTPADVMLLLQSLQIPLTEDEKGEAEDSELDDSEADADDSEADTAQLGADLTALLLGATSGHPIHSDPVAQEPEEEAHVVAMLGFAAILDDDSGALSSVSGAGSTYSGAGFSAFLSAASSSISGANSVSQSVVDLSLSELSSLVSSVVSSVVDSDASSVVSVASSVAEEANSLCRHCLLAAWDEADLRMDTLTEDELFEEATWADDRGWTCVAYIVFSCGPLSLLERVLQVTGTDVLATTVSSNSMTTGVSILDMAATCSNDPAVFRLVIRSAPRMLVAEDSHGFTPLLALKVLRPDRSNHAELFSLMRDCVAAYKGGNIFALIRLCGISTPLADLLNPRIAIWASLLRHHADPSIVVSPSATIVLSLLSRIYDRERGLVRHILEYIGPNSAPPEDEGWQMDELTKLTRANAAKDEALAAQQQTIASLMASNAALVANNTSQQQTIASQQQTNATQQQTISNYMY